MKKNKISFDSLFLMGEEIPTCPFCGSRTLIILDLSHMNKGLQVHKCLSKEKLHEFVLIDDK